MAGKETLILDIDGTILLPFKRKTKSIVEALKDIDSNVEAELASKAAETYDFIAMKKYLINSKRIESLIFEKFLSGEYLSLDEPSPGAVDFVTKARSNDCQIVYLTGRHSEKVVKGKPSGGMVEETLKSLSEKGFPNPNGKDVRIVFKKSRKDEDLPYKIGVIDGIIKNGDKIAAIFDDRSKFIIEATNKYPHVQKVGILTYGDDNTKDYKCVDTQQTRITDFLGGNVSIIPNKCIKDFTGVSIRKGCKISFA